MKKHLNIRKTINTNTAIYIIAVLVFVNIITIAIFFRQDKMSRADSGQIVISGRVEDNNGAGMPNVLVTLCDRTGKPYPDGDPVTTRTKGGGNARRICI